MKKLLALAMAVAMSFTSLGSVVSAEEIDTATSRAASTETYVFDYNSADIFTAEALLGRAVMPDGSRFVNNDPILAYNPTTRDWIFEQLARNVVDNGWLLAADTFWINAEKAVNFEMVGDGSIFSWQQVMYETIIMDYLTYYYKSSEFKSDFNKSTVKFMYKIEKNVLSSEIVSDDAFNKKIEGMTVSEARDFAKEQKYLEHFKKYDVSIYDSLIDGANTVQDYFKSIAKLSALQEADTARIKFLSELRNTTKDDQLKKAIDDVMEKYNQSLGTAAWNEFLEIGMEKVTGLAWEAIKDAFKIKIPGLSTVKLGMACMDWLFNNKGLAESRIQLTILYIINGDIMQTYINLRDTYINNPTEGNARNFVNGYSQYLAYIAYASDLTKNYLGEWLIDGAYNQIKNLFSSTNQTAYNDFCSALDSNIQSCKTLDRYIPLCNSFYNRMKGYSSSSDTDTSTTLPKENVLSTGSTFTTSGMTFKVTNSSKKEVSITDCSTDVVSVNLTNYITYNGVTYLITEIGNKAFLYCKKLSDINISNDILKEIGDEAFEYCSSLTSINIPDSVTSIGKYALHGCSSLTSIKLPDSVASIEYGAFYDCSCLASISLPDSVTSIGDNAFKYCNSLTSITIPDSVTSIGNSAFYYCTSLTSARIPNSVISIGEWAFEGCSSLASINIPDSVTSIEKGAFDGCSSLTSITIPDSVTSVPGYAFIGCRNLTSITIPDSVTSIGVEAFYGCTSLIDVYFTDTREQWNNINIHDPGNANLKNAKIHFIVSDPAVAPTCTEDGKTEGSHWSDSDIIIKPQEIIPATGHKYSTEWTIDKAATCSAEGSKSHHCSVCDDKTDVTVIAKTAHTYDSGKITIAATCTTDGVKTYICTVCGDTYTEVIKATGHKLVIDEAVAATCTNDGKTEGSHCSDCGAVIKEQEIIPATGHTYDDGKITTAATCTTDGVKTYTCTACGDIKTEVIAKTGHNYTTTVVAPTESSNGYTLHTCTVCRDSYKDNFTDPIKPEIPTLIGWQKTDGKWYYYDSLGVMQTGWLYDGDKWYYMNGSGAMQTGWVKVGGKWYYMNSSGAMQTGWVKVGAKWYYMNSSGAMQTGWVKVGAKWYYMNGSGAMQTGWVKVGAKWYYMNGSGAMQTGWVKVGGAWYYMNGSGAMQTGWLKLGNKWYYLDGNGKMVTGTKYINGKRYTFDSSGAMK